MPAPALLLERLFSDQGRAWIYRVLLAALPVLVGYKLITGEDAALWIVFGAAVLGTGTAVANTSTKSADRDL